MELALAFIGLPVATFLALASLPRGRPAAIGCVVAVAGAAVIWATQMAGGNSYLGAAAMLIFSATALAGFVQVLRLVIGAGRPRWVYPALVAFALLVAGVPMIKMLGL